jgi:hypothetical protein
MATEQQMQDDLLKEFNLGCQLWNAADYDELAKGFDVDIIMKKLDDPGSVSGIGNALVYLNKNQKSKHPHFNARVESRHVWGAGTVGQVSGTATYKDKQTDTTTTNVRFTFTYTRASEDERWLLINAFQARA